MDEKKQKQKEKKKRPTSITLDIGKDRPVEMIIALPEEKKGGEKSRPSGQGGGQET